GIGQGYWIATPIQMVKAMVALINNGKVIAPHLLLNEESGKTVREVGIRTVPGIGDKRQPLWPDGLFGSISHCATTALAVISRQR
ncbi:penicillin-binding transpeptidase domain-containing protein, partial [Salmonella enterica subsp. enterica serovar Kentucky]|nr:penicillin-binding transpeptidase domain-containing protein [Salmonella enterica subsp. enterica serovar Kentucky]